MGNPLVNGNLGNGYAVRPLPGEEEALEFRLGGEPITPDEALGVARRMARVHAAYAEARNNPAPPVPDALPPADAGPVPAAYRLPPRLLSFVRAKAEMEGTTVTAVIIEALTAYANSVPGARVEYRMPREHRRR